jgi:hypothetical protein
VPRQNPLDADLSDDRARTPRESIVRAEARQRAAESVGRAVRRRDDRRHFIATASCGMGREPMTVAQLAAWLVESHSRILGLRTEAERELRTLLAG